MPKWNPINICSYHLQEAGATPEQELSFALATAIGVLEYLQKSEIISKQLFEKIVGRISFFVNSGMRLLLKLQKWLLLQSFGKKFVEKI